MVARLLFFVVILVVGSEVEVLLTAITFSYT